MFVDIFKPGKSYQIIYADPPWEYRNRRTGGSMESGASFKYPTMNLIDIQCLPVARLAGLNCACFLWVTVPLLPDGFSVLESWGFKYKTALFWRKIMSLGMGFWFRGQVEICLLGIVGNIKPFRIQKANIIQSKARNHSEKPEEIRQLIEATGLEPRIELFARKEVNGWDCWGNEVGIAQKEYNVL